MRSIPLLLIGAGLAALAVPVAAQTAAQESAQAQAPARAQPTETLRDALLRAYSSSPQITGARADLRALDEGVPIARAGGLPGLNATTGVSENVYNSNENTNLGPTTQATVGVNASVPIYSGGAVRNSIRAADTRVGAGRANLRSSEADLFTQVVSAYMNVIRNESVVRLNQENVRVLQVNLQATRDRFEVGDLTRTDVAQSEARLALAEGQLRSAEAQLIGSRETYIQVVGTPPGILAAPPALPNLPADPSTAVSVALQENPNLSAAAQAAKAAGYDVRVANAGRLPQVSVGLSNSYFNDLGTIGNPLLFGGRNDGLSTTANVQLSMPLFQGGATAARVRQAQARQSSSLENVTFTERAVIAQARANYASWQSAMRVIESSEVAVKANQLSLEGVRAENSVGTRTILDILNAEQELLNSQVTLVTARRDAYVAGFALLASMGRAEADDLGLDGGPLYDPTTNYKRVRNKIWDWGGDADPEPLATRTTDSPVQTPVVRSDILDPIVQPPVDRDAANPAVGAN